MPGVHRRNPSLSLTKSVPNGTTYAAAGNTIPYSYLVTNTGNVTVTGLMVADNLITAPNTVSCPTSPLAPGASTTCSATYTVNQADVDRASTTNIAQASGTTPVGPVSSPTSTVTVPASGATSSLSLTKSTTSTGYGAAGNTLDYNYLVTNTGTTTISSIGISDNKVAPANISCLQPNLAPNASETCTGTYTTTQGDVDTGSVTNIATAGGKDPQGNAVTSNQSTVTVPGPVANPSVAITKLTNGSNGQDIPVGNPVTWTYQVQNTGNVTLTNVTVTDNEVASSAIVCLGSTNNVIASLAPGASVTCSATGTAVAGAYTNIGTVVGSPPSAASHNVTNTSPGSYFGSISSLGLVKSASITGFSAPNIPVTYSYAVTNTGNVALANVNVADPMTGLSAVNCGGGTNVISSLAPGATVTCTATYTTSQADVDAGKLTNTATATATPPVGLNVTTTSNAVTIPATQTPGIGITKSASTTSFSMAGTGVTYTYMVNNSGNVTLSNVTVTDPMKGLSTITCPSATLAPNTPETCTATYTTTQADMDKGWIKNTGTATGTPPTGAKVTASATLYVPAVQSPKVTIAKSASITSFSAPGTKVTYSYLVTNTGNVTLNYIDVDDPMLWLSRVTCPTSTLAPGASETCTATYTTSQADVARGSITNIGTVFALAPYWNWVAASSNKVVVPAVQTPGIGIVKTTNGSNGQDIPVGSAVTWSYAVTNTGNVTLSNVTVTDNKVASKAITCPGSRTNVIGSLAPKATVTCTATGKATAGAYTNTGTATGTPPGGGKAVTNTSNGSYFGSAPAITLAESANPGSFTASGQKITYSYKVGNTGNVPLTSVGVTNSQGSTTCPSTTLAAGATETCTATYTTTTTDVKNKSITNTGTATGTPPVGSKVTATSSVKVSYT